MNKFPAPKKGRENAQFVIFCNLYYVNKMWLSKLVHNCPPLWTGSVEKTVESVEKRGFSTAIRDFFPEKLPVDKAVETGDNSEVVHR